MKTTETENSELREYSFEVYTINPQTKEGGWGIINNCIVVAESKKEAVEKLKMYPLFDEIILFNYGTLDIDERIEDINGIYNRDYNYVKIWEFSLDELKENIVNENLNEKANLDLAKKSPPADSSLTVDECLAKVEEQEVAKSFVKTPSL